MSPREKLQIANSLYWSAREQRQRGFVKFIRRGLKNK